MSFKRTKVVMLPTNEKAGLKLGLNGLLVNNTLGYDSHFTNQHLYFLSDDEIKEGDWYLKNGESIIVSALGEIVKGDYKNCKKIIATTDMSLKQEIFGLGETAMCFLPQPSEGFIQKFVNAYNSGNPITEVMVEYNHILSTTGLNNEWLKVASDNTITIRKMKDSWTTQDVINLLQQFNNDKPGEFDCSKWIEENIYL